MSRLKYEVKLCHFGDKDFVPFEFDDEMEAFAFARTAVQHSGVYNVDAKITIFEVSEDETK